MEREEEGGGRGKEEKGKEEVLIDCHQGMTEGTYAQQGGDDLFEAGAEDQEDSERCHATLV